MKKKFNQKEYIEDWKKQNMGSVSARYNSEFVEEFKSACNKLDIAQSDVIRKVMQEVIKKSKGGRIATTIKEFEKLSIKEVGALPVIKEIELSKKEVEYLDRANIFSDNITRGIANVYADETKGFNEYELLKLEKYMDYKKHDAVQDLLYSDIKEIFESVLNKLDQVHVILLTVKDVIEAYKLETVTITKLERTSRNENSFIIEEFEDTIVLDVKVSLLEEDELNMIVKKIEGNEIFV